MRKHRNKIIINLCFFVFLSSCHTISHNNIDAIKSHLLKDKKTQVLNPNTSIRKTDNKNLELKNSLDDLPIKKLKKTSTVLKKNLNKMAKKKMESKKKKFNLDNILNLPERQFLIKFGQSDFIKYEGKLKNHQYYYERCFLDVFFIKKEEIFYVDLFELRPTKLNGFLNKENCFNEIYKTLNNK